MKRLILLRHAKSEQILTGVADFDRPLNTRGLNTAPFMGELLVRENLVPDIIICSPAKRTVQTADLVRESSGINASIVYDDRIYEAATGTLLNVISDLPDTANTAMLVGHNPGMEGVVRALTGTLEPMPTAALAVIDIDAAKWKNTEPGSGKLSAIFRPKDEMGMSVFGQ